MPRRTLPKNGEIKFNQPRSPIFLLLTLPARLLILIGDLTINVLRMPWTFLNVILNSFQDPVRSRNKQSLMLRNKFGMTKVTRKKRGRPRTTPNSIYYKRKFFKHLDKVFPKPARFAVFGIILVTILFGYSISLIDIAKTLPSPNQLSLDQEPLTTEILDRDGDLLYKIYDQKNRQLVKLDDLPTYLIQATIASEDQNFYHHHGVDVFGILRAFKSFPD
jgi:hypothetical protein